MTDNLKPLLHDCTFLHVFGDRGIQQQASKAGTPKPATRECTFYLQGRCGKGDSCKFSHASKPTLGKTATPVVPKPSQDCKFFLQGTCSKGDKCEFKHPVIPNEGRKATPVSPKSIEDCKFYLKGACSKGDQCEFKHPFKPNERKRGETTKFNMKQLKLSNLSLGTSEEDIENFLLKLGQEDPQTIKFSHDNTAAMVGFQNNIDVEYLKLKVNSEESVHILNGYRVKVDGVPFCNSILIWGIPIETSKKDIEYEILRIMGPNSVNDIDFNEGAVFAIVTFKRTDLSMLRNAVISIGGKKLLYNYYDENFITSDIHTMINGQTKKVRLMAGREILHHLFYKRRERLLKLFKTSDFDLDETGCSVVVKIENWKSDAEKGIRNEFETLISRYDSTAIIISPDVLNISRHDFLELCTNFTKREPPEHVTVKQEKSKLFITGKRKHVKESVGRFEKMKADRQMLEKERAWSSALEKIANEILQKYPIFSKENIMDWLRTDTILANEDTVSKIKHRICNYSEKNKLAFFQTEAFNNCQHRVLKDFRVVVATDSSEEEGLMSEVFVGDISTVASDVIVNSCTNVVGHGGPLARILSSAGGSEYEMECRKLRHQTIDTWDFKVTPGGNLKCRAVIHVNLGMRDSMLQALLQEILRYADSSSFVSVAIPMIGTGAHGFTRENVALNLARSIEWFKATYPSSSMKKVIIAVEVNDNEAKRAIKKHLPDSSQASVGQESVEVTFLGVNDKDLDEADSLLEKCCNEHITGTSNETIGLPSTWDEMPLDVYGKEVAFHLVPLSSSSSEYRKVERKVRSTSQGTINQIVSIQRIQNKQLYMTYMIRKQVMEGRDESLENERSLFHGTSKESSEAINHHGFNRSYAGKHAAAYGDGNYFAVNSSYSVSYAKPDMSGYRYMYLAKVLVGEYTEGSSGLKAPPKKGTGTALYDSVVNNVSNPSIFVVFPDNHAYPEYLICFR